MSATTTKRTTSTKPAPAPSRGDRAIELLTDATRASYRTSGFICKLAQEVRRLIKPGASALDLAIAAELAAELDSWATDVADSVGGLAEEINALAPDRHEFDKAGEAEAVEMIATVRAEKEREAQQSGRTVQDSWNEFDCAFIHAENLVKVMQRIFDNGLQESGSPHADEWCHLDTLSTCALDQMAIAQAKRTELSKLLRGVAA